MQGLCTNILFFLHGPHTISFEFVSIATKYYCVQGPLSPHSTLHPGTTPSGLDGLIPTPVDGEHHVMPEDTPTYVPDELQFPRVEPSLVMHTAVSAPIGIPDALPPLLTPGKLLEMY